MNILGISAYYHDSASALVMNGEIIAAAQEERFTRKKHDASFPKNAIIYNLREANIKLTDIDYIVFYEKPFVKFERLLSTYLSFAPKGFSSFSRAMPVWLKEKLFIKTTLKRELSSLSDTKNKDLPKILFSEHHLSHAASAFYPSPFSQAAILCLDGVGEWATTSVWVGENRKLESKWSIDFPHSLGLLYSAFTYYTGFKVNSGEYKLMGLAPYGENKFVEHIYDKLIDVKNDGTFRLDMEYFNYATGLSMTNKKFNNLFGGPPRLPESDITQKEMDLARSIQTVVEEIILKIVKSIHKEFKINQLCLAGGVALNCVANGKILREGPFKDIWIQPAAGDAGGALGAALFVYNQLNKDFVKKKNGKDMMKGAYLGGSFSNDDIKNYLKSVNASYIELPDNELLPKVAKLIDSGNVVGWFSGRMEFGPRALGSRSILGDPRNTTMQSTMNLKIKYRESFRPFAPVVLAEKAAEWFNIDCDSPYMLLTAEILDAKKLKASEDEKKIFGIDKLKIPRSQIPAVTHVDYSSRIQTAHKDTNARLYQLIKNFSKFSNCPILINTSFNVRGEPIVNEPKDAYTCFMRTEMDYLVMENIILSKSNQPENEKDDSWKKEFELD